MLFQHISGIWVIYATSNHQPGVCKLLPDGLKHFQEHIHTLVAFNISEKQEYEMIIGKRKEATRPRAVREIRIKTLIGTIRHPMDPPRIHSTIPHQPLFRS